MEEPTEVDVDVTVAVESSRKRGMTNVKGMEKKKTMQGRTEKGAQVVVGDGESVPGSVENRNEGSPGISVSLFEYSVENHFRAMNMISKLCGEAEYEFDQTEIERLSSSITFLSEWRHFNYRPKTVTFACQSDSPQGKDVIGGINLPQFSAATVPKMDGQNGNTISSESSKDFVMYVGGSVWALDWCPRVHQGSDCDIKSEFIAVAAHPPESSYHKIGAPLTGRGVIQIWCLLNVGMKEEDVPPQARKKTKQNPRNSERTKVKSTQPPKPRGRPRKIPINESLDNCNNQFMQALAIQFPEVSSKLLPTNGVSGDANEQVTERDSGGKQEGSSQGASAGPKQNPRNSETAKVKSTLPQKPRGRPRKMPINESAGDLECNNQHMQALAVQLPEDSSKFLPTDGVFEDSHEQVAKKGSGRKRKGSSQGASAGPEQNPTNSETIKVISTPKPRGRPRKMPINESAGDLGCNNQYVQALAVQFPDDSSKLHHADGVSGDTHEQAARKDTGRKRKGSSQGVSAGSEQNPTNSETIKVISTPSPKPRGRPRKIPINESASDLNCNYQYVQGLAVQFPEDSSKLLPMDGFSGYTDEQVSKRVTGKTQKGSSQGESENSPLTASAPRRLKDKTRTISHLCGNGLPLLTQNENNESSLVNLVMSSSCSQDPMGSRKNVASNGSLEINPARYSIPKEVALPRVMLCLAHNGKVAWDVKWRPSDIVSKHRMGYIAVLLGNGALEVWEVPFPRAIEVIYSSCQKEGTDPRFIKLEPVFRCSMLKSGDRQSIPLTMEWSASSPHDLILAGCHDGVVALWKFCANGSSKDTRPLLCFSADTVPIRALAWAPVESDIKSANIIITAGHKGLKFWDIRDPFRPLWDLNPVQRIIYSLDWLPDPRCVIISFDDGTLRILSLSKAAYDVPVTGKPFVGTQQQGLHSYYCSSFTIWCVQVSRLTGMVAYSSADGTVLRFQLTTKAVEKDPLRNRAPHFLCGSLAEEESALTVITPLPNIPFPMKKSLNEWGNAPRTIRGFLSVSNQERRAKEQMSKGPTSDEQPLALCYGDDPGIEFGSDDTLVAPKSKQAPKTKTSGKIRPKSRDEEAENVQGGKSEKGEVGDEIEAFPPKMVAMHRVRWNMNKGSERWLCYGGAGGIVRCQEINVSGA